MASIRRDGERYKVEVFVNGKRKAKRFDTKAEAKSWASQMEVDLKKIDSVVSPGVTFGSVFDRYANEISEIKKGARWEIVRLNMISSFPIARVLLIDLRREHFERYIDERLTAVKSSSVNRELNLLSHCLTQARRWRLMSHNPMEDLQRPKDPPHRERQISDREIDVVLKALSYSEEKPVIEQRQKVAVAFLLAIESGMRAGEMCSMIAENVNLDDQTVFLPDTKNGRARSVPLSKEAVRLLQRLEPWGEDGRVFGLASGVLSSLFKAGVTKTKIKDLTFHDTRHEAITRLAKKLDVLDLARMVGHRDIKQLLTYYNKSAKEIATQLG